MATRSFLVSVALLAALVALVFNPLKQRITTLGFLRPKPLPNVHGLADTLRIIPNTQHCEDLHHHVPSNQLFAACQNEPKQRYSWFPPLVNFKDPAILEKPRLSGLNVIDPEKLTAHALKLEGFSGPFVTHGIDIYADEKDPSVLYIYAINHLPNPAHYSPKSTEAASPDKARSQIELFRHKLGSDSAEFLRTVRHPMITMPNDIFATSETGFYVTNDHFYREGFMRQLEDVLEQNTAPWSDTVHVKVLDLKSIDPEKSLEISMVLTGLHNNNGLGHVEPNRPEEVMVIDAAGGVLSRARRDLDNSNSMNLTVVEQIQLDSTLDNPSYYHDPYATPANNASGFVCGGLARAAELADDWHDPSKPLPVMVWHVRTDGKQSDSYKSWKKNLIFQDSGEKVRGASAAVLIGIDPKGNAGKKQAWLFVTGFLTEGVVATKIDL